MLADKLRKAVLQAAIQGRLTKQLLTDGNAADLVAEIKKEKERLIEEKKIKKQKPLPEITAEEIPFEIPDNWCWVRLNDIGIWEAGSTPSRTNSKYYLNGQIPWVKTGDLNDEFLMQVSENITELAIEETSIKLKPIGSVLIAMYGATIGKLAILGIEATTNQACCACIPFSGIYNKYLYYYLMSYRDNFKKMGAGGAQPNISREKIIKTLIPLPTLVEQQRIVGKIEEILNQIEQLKINEEKLSLLQKNFPDKLKKSLLQVAIQGKLTEQLSTDDSVDDLLAEIRKEKEKLIKEKKIKKQKFLPPITEEEIPFEIPENWRWVRLGEIGKIVGGGTPKTDVLEYWANGNIPWITPADMKNIKGKYIYHGEKYITLLGLNKSSAQLMPKNSILFSSRAPIGYIAITKNEVSTNQGFKSIVPFDVSLTNYIYYTLLALVDSIKKIGTGTTFKEVSGSVVERIIIPLPPIREQRRIVEQLDRFLVNIKKLKL